MKVHFISTPDNQSLARLVTPPFYLSTDSCLSFKYKLNTFDLRLTLNVEHMENRTAAVNMESPLHFDLVFYKWTEVIVNISGRGWRRLVFEANCVGEGLSKARQIYLDDVMLSETPCRETKGQMVYKIIIWQMFLKTKLQ